MKVIIHWTYFFDKKGTNASFHSEWLDAEVSVLIMEDLETTGRLKEVEFEDEMGTIWTKKELTKLLVEVEDEPHEVTVFFDGGFLKEERRSGLGVAIYYEQNKKSWLIRTNAVLDQLDSNNEAEYAAFYEALVQLGELGVHHQSCIFKGDSLVVLNQLSGEWPCYEPPLTRWMDRIEVKLNKLHLRPVYEPISRKDNQEADRLASQALKGEDIFSKLELK